jgi:hypothetical protein
MPATLSRPDAALADNRRPPFGGHAMPPKEAVNVNVLLDDNVLDDEACFNQVLDRLRDAGLKVIDKPMRIIGVVRGTVAPGKRRALQQVKGVSTVQDEKELRLSPPEDS